MRGRRGNVSDPLPHDFDNRKDFSTGLENKWDLGFHEKNFQFKRVNFNSSPIREIEEDLGAHEQSDENHDGHYDGHQLFHNMLNLLTIKKTRAMNNGENVKVKYQTVPDPNATRYNLIGDTHLNILMDESNQFSNSGSGLPSFFNPRMASNMSHREKVNEWLDNIPCANLNKTDFYYFNKYSGMYNNVGLYSLNWEEEIFEKDYKSLNLMTNEDLILYQAKKIDTLIRKNYHREKESNFENITENSKDCINNSVALCTNISTS
ncbi:hypothetical protein TPHA_0A05370 [Tetrapisispora phaffii CBS 4417]|uniref:Uncharacterized protein n=1 Tax=Tetrapisispora phaffii (strain ATCC 24235 / CBS 4417 / NBRC 1672 / NRRL Y-8282 / UCD 70-5) TaxID=1071381 RepID=G8BNY3_TETPH|nr:hypothetical protein TPHA_0A05370 [Tetrapisispora phaffii CBS 4417]CCE61611.1 hypothetical protein TPHA_0A05370 [Tetrapisispora phaffii CBS 4417]